MLPAAILSSLAAAAIYGVDLYKSGFQLPFWFKTYRYSTTIVSWYEIDNTEVYKTL